jgi:multiple sugar transport system permease protein
MRRNGVNRAGLLELGADLVVIAFVLFSTLPILWLFLTSLKPEEEIVTRSLRYLPDRFTLEHYGAIWHQSGFPNLLLNSAVTTSLTVALCLATGTIAAYAFSRAAFPGHRGLLLAYVVIRMFPAVLMIIPLFVLMREMRLLDTNLGLALAYTSFLLPLFVWILKGFFDAVPPDLEDAARIDGCTRLGAMTRVILPVVRTGALATTVFVAIAAWNEFLFALMLTTSAGSRTWPVGLQLMVGEFQLPWGMLSAGGMISIVPPLILFALAQRTMMRGLTAGTIKG